MTAGFRRAKLHWDHGDHEPLKQLFRQRRAAAAKGNNEGWREQEAMMQLLMPDVAVAYQEFCAALEPPPKEEQLEAFPDFTGVTDRPAPGVAHRKLSQRQRGAVRAYCDSKDLPIPDDLDNWTRVQASNWLEEHDFKAWQREHPQAA